MDFVARFGAKATKASQAQSRLKSLDRMESIEIKPLPVTAKIRIPPPARTGKQVLNLKNVTLGYGEKRVLQEVNLQMAAGDHLAVVGLNGAGKSTLLKGLAGRLAPLSGSIEYGYEVTLAFFNQHVAEELDPSDTVVKALHARPILRFFRRRSSISPERCSLRETMFKSRSGSFPEEKDLSSGARTGFASEGVLSCFG